MVPKIVRAPRRESRQRTGTFPGFGMTFSIWTELIGAISNLCAGAVWEEDRGKRLRWRLAACRFPETTLPARGLTVGRVRGTAVACQTGNLSVDRGFPAMLYALRADRRPAAVFGAGIRIHARLTSRLHASSGLGL